jgi:Ni/Co efflux regulator RcnB
MSKLILIASAAAMAFSMPALAQGQGKGNSHSAHAQSGKSKANKAQARTNRSKATRTDARTVRGDANRNGILDRFERDSDGDGIPDYREGRVQRTLDRNGNGILDRFESGSRMNMCPPGLAKKTPACVPPGQAKARSFNQGQRLPTSYRQYTDYNRIPESYRDDIPESYRGDAYRYVYRDDRIYVVDRTSRIVRAIIDQFD